MHNNQRLYKSPIRETGFRRPILVLMAVLCLLLPSMIVAAELELPKNIDTYEDGRQPIEELYESYTSLLEQGWKLDIITRSQPRGRAWSLPIIALRTPHTGASTWILSGIHGEEPAGPNAIAESIDAIAALGEQQAVVVLPLNNPHGYVNNWRYLNMEKYSKTVEGQSVGDSSHFLANPEDPARARSNSASSPEAGAITRYILKLSELYPPVSSIDLHEDNLIEEGYVYSQGALGTDDPLAHAAVQTLREHDIPIKMSGQTRFDEDITGGIIGPLTDGSIDELMSAATVIVGGRPQPGPAARTVLVFETPAGEVDLQQRIDAHAAFLRSLMEKGDASEQNRQQ